ncbi:hypothetical protein SGLAD_v1c05760 [Spiroplasma gladiatoris]|uniref:Uncharacterized protein n=1 Tax=Spiroplasma gladiatoris TaxID=2143 RepID=A0A4P7AH66_9MOLU|nr:hypothetical protein [Spiroplasma gladiatoris]QBQ07775.1 hypothetical protein SGLAD_v1c05760 [Spiroplasma gladiatoris]
MSFNFDKDTDWIFTFCKSCWDYKKFIFDKPINFFKAKKQKALCISCKNCQNINLEEAREYYCHLNDNNK